MDLDELTVPHRHSGLPVYRLRGGSRFDFRPDEGDPAELDRVWPVVASALAELDGASHWIGPLDTRARPLPESPDAAGELRAALREGWAAAMTEFEAVTLRVFSSPAPPRQQLSLIVPAPASREPWASLVVGESPSSFFASPEAVIERTLRGAALLRPHAGSVGLCLMSEPWMEHQHTASALPYLQRYPGLGLPHRLERGAGGSGIGGVDWLTILGEDPLELIGGIAGLRDCLREAARSLDAPEPELFGYDGGVLVRAGEMPKLGDSEGEGAPLGYRVVDAALRPLRWDGRPSRRSALLKAPPGVDAEHATLRWARRFE